MSKLLVICTCVFACAAALPATATAAQGTPVPGQYIVVLKKGATGKSVAAEHARSANARVSHIYDAALHGYAARLSDAGLVKVKGDPRVDFVQQDVQGNPLGAQTLPTGINRIDAELSATVQAARTSSAPVAGDVAVYDTGIDTGHPDLNVAGGVNCLGTISSYNDGTISDQNGHGTHIAGTIGAKDDANGVVGVAPGVRLWSVRVNDSFGGSTASKQLCGINWVTANGPGLGIRVVNASQTLFGSTTDDGNCGYSDNDAMHQAICRSAEAGITWVFAAMNATRDFQATGGATFDQVLTVTAMGDSNGQPNVGSTAKFTCTPPYKSNSKMSSETDDKYTSFSNFATLESDKAHTIAAPGHCIWSTWKNQTYGYQSGTSMATPHAVGTVHLCIVSGQCTGTPAEIIQKVRSDAAAFNLASSGFGFTGDPLRPISGRYYGHLLRAGVY
jgi:subtilisin